MLCFPQLKDSRVLRVCSFNLGAAYVEAGRPQRGLDFLQKAEPGPKADRIPDLQFNLALAHNALGQSQEASTLFLQAAHLYRSQGAGGSEGDACMEMGRCYTRTQVRTRKQVRNRTKGRVNGTEPSLISPVSRSKKESAVWDYTREKKVNHLHKLLK